MSKLESINIKEARNLLNHYGLPCDGTEEEIKKQLEVLEFPTDENIRSDEEDIIESKYDQRDDYAHDTHDVEIDSELEESEPREHDTDTDRDTFVYKTRWSDDPSSSKNIDNSSMETIKDVETTNDVISNDGSDDYDLPKSRKEFPSEDERTDSVLDTSLHDSEDGSVTSSPPRLQTVVPLKDDINNPLKPQDSIINVGDVSSLNLSSLNIRDSEESDLESNVSKIVNPIISCIADLKSDIHAEVEKLHYRVDPNLLGSTKGSDDWQQSGFEKSLDQNRYDSVITAGKLLDLVLTFSLPDEVNERISQARHILWEKALLYRLTSSTESSSSPALPEQGTSVDSAVDHVNKIINRNNDEQITSGQYVSTQEDIDVNQVLPNDEIIENLPDSTKVEEIGDRSPVSNGMTKSRRLPNQNHRRSNRARRRSTSVQLDNATGSGSRPLQESSSSRDVERQDDIRLSTSPKAPYRPRSSNGRNNTNIPTNNRRFVGFLPSRCFTCGGIGHFANNCPNKGSYITTLSPQQPVRRRRSTRFKRNTKVDASGEQ
ncbi:26681_t:CDS:1 [Dentiscutata erythropus]|uniref:26681_t:CDS:1 n=1 Tax=Dentiscutata erythropus TaxID=1348616 RepID=A0A9N9DW52_9GLOM|nr:26681_t:CDS:1 [Dentiscutata erythropus]